MDIETSAVSPPASTRAIEIRLAGLIAIALAAYWPTCSALWHYWGDDLVAGGQSALVAALALWLLYRARDRVASARPQALPWALVLLVPASIASVIFWRASIEELQFAMLPALILLAVWAAFGTAVVRAIAVPVGFLYFAMPGWNLLAGPLQAVTLGIVRLLAPAIGVPARVSGSSILLPDDMGFSVTLMCSGVGFLVEGLAVATLLGELEQAPWKRRLRLLGSMAVVAILTNWIRVLAIVQLGYSTQMRHVLITRHHLLFGYVLFVGVLAVFVWVARRGASPHEPPATPATARLGSFAPFAYVSALVALAGAPVLAGALSPSATSEAAARELRLPPGRADWQGPLATFDALWRPVFVGLHREWRGSYRDRSGDSVQVIAIGYDTQTQGQELVNEGNSITGSGGLTSLNARLVYADGTPYREDVVADEHGSRSLIWSFYLIGARPLATPLWAQMWYGVDALGVPPYSALFALRTACSPSCAEARDALTDFVRAMRPGLLAAPQNARASGSR